jgi:uncharacterized protein YidB (DUF937 family)
MRAPFGKAKAERALREAEELEGEGRHLEAIAVLTEANRRKRDPQLEVRLVQVRNRAFGELGDGEPDAGDPATDVPRLGAAEDAGLPSVEAADISASGIRAALLDSGCLIVRGLIDPGKAAALVGGIDDAFGRRDNGNGNGAPDPIFHPFEPEPEYEEAIRVGRKFVAEGSGIWTADSPRVLFDLLETFEDAGLRETLTEYLGERPAISVNKGTLRRAAPTVGTEWWHQDGAFLGAGIRSINIWLSLTPSGVEAPGLEVVPQRLEEIVETGTEGADFDWSVGEPVVERLTGGDTRRPVFEAGDALLFDHVCLHRTGSDASMTKTRYATETWFFAPSAYPDPLKQVPLAF